MRWLLLSVVLFWGGWAEAQAPARKALLIGNAGYSQIAPLDNPVRDVELIERALQSANFEVRVVKDARQTEMNAALDNFLAELEANPGAVALIYFSGHGLQSDFDPTAVGERGRVRNYILGTDFDDTVGAIGFVTSAVPVDGPNSLAYRLEKAGTSQNIVVIDACRSVYQPRNIQVRGFAPVQLDEVSDTFYIFATKPEDVAMDRAVTGDGLNSPFAMAFAEMLGKSGHGPSSIMPALVNRVRALTGNAQTPYSEGVDRGLFKFRPGAQESLADVKREAETMIWEAVKASRSQIRVADFLASYPDGAHADEARALLDRLVAGLETDIAREKNPQNSAAQLGLSMGQSFAGGKWTVSGVHDGSIFEGKLLAGDELYNIDGRRVSTIEDPEAEIVRKIGEEGRVAITVLRNGRPYRVSIR